VSDGKDWKVLAQGGRNRSHNPVNRTIYDCAPQKSKNLLVTSSHHETFFILAASGMNARPCSADARRSTYERLLNTSSSQRGENSG
jgi:hypothetical protein